MNRFLYCTMGQPLNRLMYIMNCGVRCRCGIPLPKCISTCNGPLLWFSRVIFLKQKTSCCSPDNDFLLRMKFSLFQGPERAHAIRPFASSLIHLFYFPGSELTSATPSAWKVLPPNNQIDHSPSLHSGSAKISFPQNNAFLFTFCPSSPGLFSLREITTTWYILIFFTSLDI